MDYKEITTNSVTFTRDLVRQGHAWLQVTFLISGRKHARSKVTRKGYAVGCYLIAFSDP